MISRLKKCNIEINALDVMAENSAVDTKLKYVEVLDVLHTKKRDAAKKIKELESASADTWVKIKLSVDEIWDDLGIAGAWK